jgi:hypothetical protein
MDAHYGAYFATGKKKEIYYDNNKPVEYWDTYSIGTHYNLIRIGTGWQFNDYISGKIGTHYKIVYTSKEFFGKSKNPSLGIYLGALITFKKPNLKKGKKQK